MVPPPAVLTPPLSVNPETSELDELELRIARRADQLAVTCPGPTRLNLRCWLLAEAEVLRGMWVAPAIDA